MFYNFNFQFKRNYIFKKEMEVTFDEKKIETNPDSMNFQKKQGLKIYMREFTKLGFLFNNI